MMLPTGKINRAFTLIEVLISVVILGFGLLVVIRSFSSSVRGLNATGNYIEAMKFAKEKLTELEIKAWEDGGLYKLGVESGVGQIGSREIQWFTEVKEIEEDQESEEIEEDEEIEEEESLGEKFVEVCMRLDWKEGNIAKDAALAAYLPRYNENEEEESQ